MKATAHFKMDEDLYRQIWADWIRYVSRGRKWSIPVSLLCIAVGVIALIVLGIDSEHRTVSIFFVLIGIFNVVWHFWDKHKWFRNRRSANVTGQDIEIRFEDDRISMTSPSSKSESEWTVFQKIVTTESGMFLYPQQGIYIYVPDSALQPADAKTEIITKIKGNLPNHRVHSIAGSARSE